MPESPDSSKMAASVLRKIKKPIIEKKRRDRINHSLEELKNILLENVRKTDTPISRLDKADILEMTVKYVQQLRKQVNTSTAPSDDTIEKEYKSGYEECKRETIYYLNYVNGNRHDMKSPERVHLSSCVGQANGQLSTLQYAGRNSLFHTPITVSSNNYLTPLNVNIPSSIKIPSTTARKLDYNRGILKPVPIHPLLKTESPYSPYYPLTASASIICSTPTDDPRSEQSSGYSSCHTQSFQEADLSMDKDLVENSVNDNSLTFDKNIWRPW
ncbi:hypothetical protein ACJMK2_017015 [Sinanodonta woodiana]|uniref:BHLH domain-containing protein n=1 Tax=Sinanodonta woodiana TaxID=1069815 RepID=A0ABD3UVJ5_SINWO